MKKILNKFLPALSLVFVTPAVSVAKTNQNVNVSASKSTNLIPFNNKSNEVSWQGSISSMSLSANPNISNEVKFIVKFTGVPISKRLLISGAKLRTLVDNDAASAWFEFNKNEPYHEMDQSLEKLIDAIDVVYDNSTEEVKLVINEYEFMPLNVRRVSFDLKVQMAVRKSTADLWETYYRTSIHSIDEVSTNYNWMMQSIRQVASFNSFIHNSSLNPLSAGNRYNLTAARDGRKIYFYGHNVESYADWLASSFRKDLFLPTSVISVVDCCDKNQLETLIPKHWTSLKSKNMESTEFGSVKYYTPSQWESLIPFSATYTRVVNKRIKLMSIKIGSKKLDLSSLDIIYSDEGYEKELPVMWWWNTKNKIFWEGGESLEFIYQNNRKPFDFVSFHNIKLPYQIRWYFENPRIEEYEVLGAWLRSPQSKSDISITDKLIFEEDFEVHQLVKINSRGYINSIGRIVELNIANHKSSLFNQFYKVEIIDDNKRVIGTKIVKSGFNALVIPPQINQTIRLRIRLAEESGVVISNYVIPIFNDNKLEDPAENLLTHSEIDVNFSEANIFEVTKFKGSIMDSAKIIRNDLVSYAPSYLSWTREPLWRDVKLIKDLPGLRHSLITSDYLNNCVKVFLQFADFETTLAIEGEENRQPELKFEKPPAQIKSLSHYKKFDFEDFWKDIVITKNTSSSAYRDSNKFYIYGDKHDDNLRNWVEQNTQIQRVENGWLVSLKFGEETNQKLDIEIENIKADEGTNTEEIKDSSRTILILVIVILAAVIAVITIGWIIRKTFRK